MNNDIERYNFWNLENESFAKQLWKRISALNFINKKETALVILFKGLIDEHNKPNNCNDFITHLMLQSNGDISSDILVHTLNALSPIKHNLPSWELFVKFCYDIFVHERGKDYADILMRYSIV